MDRTPNPYRRLPGAGYRRLIPGWAIVLLFFVIGLFVLLFRGRRVVLWLGPDHLLEVESDGYRERYTRFFYRDIQAVVLRKTLSGKMTNVICGVLALAFAAITASVSDAAFRIVWGSVAGLFLLVVGMNWALGPTCICHIRTAVRTVELVSFRRLRSARRALALLRPRVEAEQGPLPADAALGLASAADPATALPPLLAQTPAPEPPPPLRHSRGSWHAALCWLCLTDVPLTILSYALENPWVRALSGWQLLASIALAIVALIRQQRTDLPKGVRRIPLAVIITLTLFLIVGFIYGLFLAVERGPAAARAEATVVHDSVSMVLSVVSTLANATLGTLGLVLLRRFRASAASGAAGNFGPPGNGPEVSA